MTDSDIYCTLELPAATQVPNGSRSKLKAVLHRPRLSCLVTVALGLLTVILLSLVMYQRILCCGCKDCPSCPDLWIPIREHLGNNFYWIGLRNKDGWRWEDGPVLSLRILSNSLIQRCGAIHRTGLQASSCEVPLQWICKKAIH